MSSSGNNWEALTQEQFGQLIQNHSAFLATGSSAFYGPCRGRGLDYVLSKSRFKYIMGFDFEMDREGWRIFNYVDPDSKQSYNFIVVREDRFSDWEMATQTAITLIKNNEAFKEWFKIKGNRKDYFSCFIYTFKQEHLISKNI